MDVCKCMCAIEREGEEGERKARKMAGSKSICTSNVHFQVNEDSDEELTLSVSRLQAADDEDTNSRR